MITALLRVLTFFILLLLALAATSANATPESSKVTLLIAVGHIVGSLIVVRIIGYVSIFIGAWELKRHRRHLLEEASIQLGVTVDDLDKEEMAPRVIQFSSERYSSALFRNRFSDRCGTLQTGWGRLGVMVQAGVLVAVVWYTITDSRTDAVYAWTLVALSLVFWMVGVIFSFACLLLTGRYPGQPEQARRAIAGAVRNRGAAYQPMAGK
jgi:hypothetical protein